MSEVAANSILPGRRRRQRKTSRIIQYLLLQALIAALCVLALRQSLPAPPAEYLITEFRMTEGGTERAVTLPHFTASRYPIEASPRFSAQFVRPRDESRPRLVGVPAALHQWRGGDGQWRHRP